MTRPGTSRRWTERVAAAALLAVAGARADGWQPPLDEALKTAATRHAPVLIEFHAPWCYSCYYMQRNVLNGAEWDKVRRDAVLVDLDADAPEGAYWEKQLVVKALPSYVVLNEQGDELGRILGEQTRAEFYRQLDVILARTASLDEVRDKVKDGGGASLKAAHEVLKSYYARNDADGALAWRAALPQPVQAALDKDARARLWLERLRLMQAAQAGNAAQCAALAPPVLAGELGCDRAYELDRVMECSASLPPAERSKLFAAQKPVMTHQLYGQVFIAHPSCADARSIVLTTADLDKNLGYPQAENDVLDQAIADAKQRLGGNLKKDRNLADNLRVFLERAGKTDELELLYPKLIAAWPDDYVYYYRFGKTLAVRGQYQQALIYFQQAAPKAYGVNRLNVAEQRAEVLLKLNRADDARQVVADALKANGPWFPEQAAKLKALVALN
ncbi:MAG TPA: thioredoxin family protein [Nevskia sp.]|nr:thioredoxin family protein [Nevskia sp.]